MLRVIYMIKTGSRGLGIGFFTCAFLFAIMGAKELAISSIVAYLIMKYIA